MVNNGIVLGKRYNILSKIGAGGMADVYKGKDLMLNRYVAVKVLKKEYREDEMFVRKFRSEAQAAAGLLHPNIVNVYDVGEDRGLQYMVQELVEGITLKDYIQKKGRLTPNEVISIAIQMCSGIGAAHAAGIVHRDIKPQNIMISKEGKVKVTDFGIAKAITSNTISSNAMGSVHYTSPEQARGGFSDQKSDIYSVGITLYEMITGRVPFNGESTVEVALKHLQEEITPPSEYVPDIPYALEQIILKCTQKNSERRYANTAELIRDLKHALVNPDGHFVKINPQRNADTVIISDEELDDIRGSYKSGDDYDEDEYEEDDEDEYEYEYEDDEEEDDEEEEQVVSRRRNDPDSVDPGMNKAVKMVIIVIAVIIVAIGAFAIAKTAGLFNFSKVNTEEETEQVEVPNLLGMTEAEAKAALNEKGLGYKVKKREESKKYEEGQICGQSVEEGEKVDKNTTIYVVVSSGIADEKIEVEDVSGMSEDNAQKVLEDQGFTNVSSKFEYSDDVEQGYVIETDPAAGSEITKDTKIVMIVSKGSEKIEVPDVTGYYDDSAQNTIAAYDLTVGNVTYQYDDDVEEGVVISQDPAGGSKVEEGTVVNLWVSRGPEPDPTVEVPPIVGSTLSNAQTLISSAGLTVGKVTYEYSSTVPAGNVISCSPGSGAEVDEGSSVSIVVSQGPEPSSDTTGDGSETEEDIQAQ